MSLQEPPDDAFVPPKPVPRFKHDVPFRAAAMPADGTVLIGLDAQGTIRGWDARTGRPLYGRPVLAKEDPPQRLTCSPDGRFVALSSRDLPPSTVRVLRLSTGEEVRRFDRGFSPAFSPDGEILIATDGPNLRRWAMKSGAELPALQGWEIELKWAAYSPKGDRIAASDAYGGTLVTWDAVTRSRAIHTMSTRATALVFAPDGKTLAYGNHWGVRFLNLSGEPGREPSGHEEYATGPLRYSADGRRMIAVARRRRLLIWDLATGRPLFTWSAFNLPDGVLEVSEGGDRVIWFDVGGLRVERIPQLLGGKEAGHVVRQVSFTSDGRAVTADDAGNVRLWDPATQKEVKGYKVPAQKMKFITRQGRWVVYGGGADPVVVWDLAEGKEVVTVPKAPYVGGVAISPDSSTLALGHSDGSLTLWNISEKKERARIDLDLAGVSAVSWSPDGKTMSWGDEQGAVVIADGITGRDSIRFKPRAESAIRELQFEPDGKTLLARNARGACWTYAGDMSREPVLVEPRVRLGDRTKLDHRWVASGLLQTGSADAVSPDGAYAVTVTGNGEALLWEAPGGK